MPGSRVITRATFLVAGAYELFRFVWTTITQAETVHPNVLGCRKMTDEDALADRLSPPVRIASNMKP